MNESWLWVIAVLLLLWFFNRQSSSKKKSNTAIKRPMKRDGTSNASEGPFRWPPLGEFDFEVVGESHYQSVLHRNAGDHGKESASAECIAQLILEDGNQYDDKAVEVRVDGQTVAYLSRDDARSFRRRLNLKGLRGQTTFCDAQIVGGGVDRSGKKYSYGIRLDMKPFGED